MENNQGEQNKEERLDLAIADMQTTLNEMSSMFQKIKKIKFDYLVKTCDVYTKVDMPTIMMDTCDKDFKQLVPTADNIRKMNF